MQHAALLHPMSSFATWARENDWLIEGKQLRCSNTHNRSQRLLSYSFNLTYRQWGVIQIVAWLSLKVNCERAEVELRDDCTCSRTYWTEETRRHKDMDTCQLTSAQSCGCLRSAAPASLSALERTGTWSCIPLGVSPGRSPQFQLGNGRHEAGQKVFQYELFGYSFAANVWSNAAYWTKTKV